jgi:hypothetical protein
VQVFVFFCFDFACLKKNWFFLFDVLCRCNLSGFYITFIISTSFFFSFLSFVVYFILFIMSTTMKKVCSGGSTDLVLEVLKNTLPIASTLPTPPKQLLDLILYGSFLIGLPTPIITTNFGDDILWASDESEIHMQCVHYMHESPT